MFAPHPHRVFWDSRYREAFEARGASAWLERWIAQLPPGRAVDVACGTGRNAVALAARGWHVLGIDISPVGLRFAQRAAGARGLRVDWVAADLHAFALPFAAFDLVCVFRFLDRSLCPRLAALVRPGGTLIYETFTTEQRRYEGGPRSDSMLLQPGELPTLFPQFQMLEHTEGVVIEDERPRALAGFVGRRAAVEPARN